VRRGCLLPEAFFANRLTVYPGREDRKRSSRSMVSSYNSNGEFIRTFGGPRQGGGAVILPSRSHTGRSGKTPILTLADRANNRIQHFWLDGSHIEFVNGVNLPCHFSIFKNGDVVVPDLGARVGDVSSSNWRETRKEAREKFTTGKLVCPHGACFDHAGNIDAVEWVEVGRVSSYDESVNSKGHAVAWWLRPS